MRYRHGNVNPSTGVFKGYVNGDSDRVEMQQKFLKAVVDQKVNALCFENSFNIQGYKL